MMFLVEAKYLYTIVPSIRIGVTMEKFLYTESGSKHQVL